MGIAQVYICSRCLRIWDTSSQAISCCGAVARPASICTENVLDEQRRTIENATEENERLLDALKDRQARCSELADKLAERQQMCRDLAATLDKAHGLVTQWLARPEPPNTGELVALATILEGSKQPEDGREIK